WPARCEWIKQNSEKEEAILVKFNEQLNNSGRLHLIIFDALDRLGTDWKSIRLLTRSLLTVVLDLRSFSAFRAKMFIRLDMESDRDIWSIRDGSKLKQNSVNLAWNTKDLYGFVWHWFLLEPGTRSQFAELSKKVNIDIETSTGEHLIKVPLALLEDEEKQ